MGIPFIDLKSQYARIQDQVNDNIQAVLNHGRYIMGPEIQELETGLAEFAGTKHCLGCGSGTDALLLALMALGAGPGDAVFTTPFTFMATAEAIALLGATPVFVDIDPETYNLDPDKLRLAVEALEQDDPSIHPLPDVKGLTARGVIAVGLFGLSADYAAIRELCDEKGLYLIGDEAQSFGATYDGKPVTSLSDISCTSFFPAKPLGAYGDGGAVFTDSDEYHALMHSIRVHGQGTDKYDNVRLGLNARLDTLQAAILLPKLAIFPEEIELRQKVAETYNELLAGSDVVTPVVPENCVSVWAQYSVLTPSTERRSQIMEALKAADVPTAMYYPLPLHLQGAYKELGYRPGSLPVCEDVATRIFSLPMHPYLERGQQETIADIIKNA